MESKLTVFDREYFFANMTTYLKDDDRTLKVFIDSKSWKEDL